MGRRPLLGADPKRGRKNWDSHAPARDCRNGNPGNGGEAVPAPGEVLILLSDGVDGEVALRQSDLTPDWPPGELAAKILESGRGKVEDDATAAVIRLVPTGLSIS